MLEFSHNFYGTEPGCHKLNLIAMLGYIFLIAYACFMKQIFVLPLPALKSPPRKKPSCSKDRLKFSVSAHELITHSLRDTQMFHVRTMTGKRKGNRSTKTSYLNLFKFKLTAKLVFGQHGSLVVRSMKVLLSPWFVPGGLSV